MSEERKIDIFIAAIAFSLSWIGLGIAYVALQALIWALNAPGMAPVLLPLAVALPVVPFVWAVAMGGLGVMALRGME